MTEPMLIDIGVLMAESLKKCVNNERILQGFRDPATLPRIKYFYTLLLKFDLIASQTTAPKSNGQSRKLRQLGNKSFKRGGSDNILEALEFYNEAICWAESYDGEELALAYGNRSAVYFEWKEYKFCRDNIKLAKLAGVPPIVLQKLNDRDAQCVAMLVKAQKTNAEQRKTRPEVTLSVGARTTIDMVESMNPTPMYSYDKYHGEASLSLTPNPKAPFAAKCLEMKCEPKRGHYVATNEDLKPGQIIAVETPFVHAMTMKDDRYRYRKCANCYEESCLNLIPCSSCTNTMYCSEKCLNESVEHHQFECPISEFLLSLCYGDTLSVRFLLKVYSSFDSTSDLDEFLKTNAEKVSKNSSFPFNTEMDDKKSLQYVHGLPTNENMKDIPQLLQCYCKVATLYYVLTHKTKFVEILKTQADHDNLMEALHRYVQISNQNSVTCTQYKDFDISDAGDNKSITMYSQGIYPLTSLLNHSCAPNVASVSNGSKLITYVSRVIKKGSEVMRGYSIGNFHYFQHTKANRQKMLYDQYSLRCRCEACIKDYPPHHGKIAKGKLPSKYDMLLGMRYVILDIEVEQLERILEVLRDFDYMLPCLSINELQLRVQKIMKLKYGDISTKLKMAFSKYLYEDLTLTEGGGKSKK